MHSEESLLYTEDESSTLKRLLTPVNEFSFLVSIRRLHTLFDIYASTSPVPIPASGLIITPEIRTQCEQYLPIATITAVFNRLYSDALAYQPILTSTPFHNAMSWADVFSSLPKEFQFSANPARLLESLLANSELLTRFLFASFLPGRFYGTMDRYPMQQEYIREWLVRRKESVLHCLDTACGTGEGTYKLALLLSESGFLSGNTLVEGWTVEPLEVWAATHRRFPLDRRREALLRRAASALYQRGYDNFISFVCVDLTKIPLNPPLPKGETIGADRFDLILCNGLLGGPILHKKEPLDRTVGNLAQLLAPGGILLTANNFHGGWKQKSPQSRLRALFEVYGLKTFEAGEGIAGLKPD